MEGGQCAGEDANVMSESGESSSIVAPETPLPDTARPFRFTWDPSAARRPGPESVSGTTTGGREDYFATRLGELPFNASGATLALGALPADWSSSKHGFHGAWLAKWLC
jgi:vacuolar protein sorting-associated protein 54